MHGNPPALPKDTAIPYSRQVTSRRSPWGQFAIAVDTSSVSLAPESVAVERRRLPLCVQLSAYIDMDPNVATRSQPTVP